MAKTETELERRAHEENIEKTSEKVRRNEKDANEERNIKREKRRKEREDLEKEREILFVTEKDMHFEKKEIVEISS